MSRGKRRSLIPNHFHNLPEWPLPCVEALSEADRTEFLMRKRAVEMYAANSAWEAIASETGKSPNEVRRLVSRCARFCSDGQIWGYYALIPQTRMVTYRRRSNISHIPGLQFGSCTGALSQVFEKYPDLTELVEDWLETARAPQSISRSRMTYIDVAENFRKELVARGATEEDWPFNTADLGVEALRRYGMRLRDENEDKWIAGRYGKEAARRGEIGRGFNPLIPILRPYVYGQMDYQTIDAASIIVLIHPVDGSEVEVPVARWHVGLVCEQKKKLVTGVYCCLEMTPSAESALNTIASAVFSSPPGPILANDALSNWTGEHRFLPVHFIPELEGECFAAIKVDNAWGNAAHGCVDQLVDYLGSAVNFGRVRAWWRRAVVERIFLEITRRGAQTLSSTYGSGPKDGRRDKPIEKAIKYRIMLSEVEALVRGVVREYNESSTRGLLGLSPLDAMRAAMQNPASGYVSQKLPRAKIDQNRLAFTIERLTVKGNIKKHVRPYVESQGCRWTNEQMSRRYGLVNKELHVSFCNADCTVAFAAILESGEDLGQLHPSNPWREYPITRRDQRLIESWARKQRRSDGTATVAAFMRAKREELVGRSRSKKKQPSRDALTMARISRAQKIQPNPPSLEPHEGNTFPNLDLRNNPFGLGSIPGSPSESEDHHG